MTTSKMKYKLTFSNAHRYEPDNWKIDAEKTFSTDGNLQKLEAEVLAGKMLIAEHWHYRGASCPTRLVVEDYDDFIEYLQSNAIAGDIVDIFDISDLWKNKKLVLSGKCPDESQEIPEKGAY